MGTDGFGGFWIHVSVFVSELRTRCVVFPLHLSVPTLASDTSADFSSPPVRSYPCYGHVTMFS
ncbi:MAG: hypothetical protein LRY73_06795, partial [Bacillus sp. (in: Bacteria)]|nr:hypothetical protein [Bacillus sp. (in: firmicutes)]